MVGFYPVLPESAEEAERHSVKGHVVRLVEGPVPGGEGAGQDHLAQGRREEQAPKEPEQVVKLNTRANTHPQIKIGFHFPVKGLFLFSIVHARAISLEYCRTN